MKKFLREHLQLMELLICIFFFMAGSLMAGALFIRASQIEQASEELQSAVSVAQQQAEKLRVQDELVNEVIYYDNEWQICSEAEYAYKVVIEAQSQHVAVISVYRVNENTEFIYQIKAGGKV